MTTTTGQSIINITGDYLKTFSNEEINLDELNNAYGLEAQNEALEYLESLEKGNQKKLTYINGEVY